MSAKTENEIPSTLPDSNVQTASDPPRSRDVSQENSDCQTCKSAASTPADQGVTEDSTANKGPRKIIEISGIRFFELERVSVSTEQHFQNLKVMPMRSDDIIITSFPKCGSHWLWEVVHMLTSGKVEYEKRTKDHLMPEFNDVEKFLEMPSPRILNSHLFLGLLSDDINAERPRIINVIRNPKDVVVSFYFHLRQRIDFEDKGILNFAENFLEGGSLPGNCFLDYFTALTEMDRWQMDHPDIPFINIYYEDMKRDPVTGTQSLAAFLDLELTDEFCAQVAEACSFHKMKAADESKTGVPSLKIKNPNPTQDSLVDDDDATASRKQPPTEPHPSQARDSPKPMRVQMYRKGQVGDWKQYLTVALSERFDAVTTTKLQGCVNAKNIVYEHLN